MHDIVLTAPTEAELANALPAYRGEEGWANCIADATRWVRRPAYDAEGNLIDPGERVAGFTAIIRANEVPAAAAAYVVDAPGDIEPIPAGGLVPAPADTPSVPPAVSRFQARAALHLAGLLDQVETLMADPATDVLARLAWSDAQEFVRTSPTIATMAAALGLSDAQVDDLFRTAAGISA